MPRLAPVTRTTRLRSVDVQHRPAGDAALGQRADRVARLAPADLEVDLRVELAGGEERQEAAQRRGGAAAAVELVEDVEAVEARAGGADEQGARGELGRGRIGAREGDGDAVAGDSLQRGAEADAADAFEDDVEPRPLWLEVVDHLVGAEVDEAAGSVSVGRDAGDVRPGAVRELDGEAPDAAAGSGDEHAASD